MKLEKILSKDAIITINNNKKFFVEKKIDTKKIGIGMETLWLISQIEDQMDSKKKHNPKRLMNTFDLLDSFYDTNILTFKTILDIKNELLGKDYVKKCCYYAIFRCYANDIDLVKTLQSFNKPEKQKAIKHKKQKSIGVKK